MVKEEAGGTVYRGTAGIALFLGELYKHTQDATHKSTAEGGLTHALNEVTSLPSSSFGFHSGRVGIAWVAAILAERLDKPGYIMEAEQVLEPLRGKESKDRGVDVIAGAAGAIPALLQMSEKLPHELTVDMAVILGEHLINVAHKEPIGWSWETIRSSSVRHLCGLAHGASGIGHAFLELYHATEATRFLYAAEQAFLYERQFFDAEQLNWPDFRHAELSEFLYHGRTKELRDAVGNGGLAPYEVKFMSAWCHGAPGIGMARLRAYELIGSPLFREEAEHTVEATKRSLNISGGNYSLCHGRAGNAETLLYAAEVFQDDKLRDCAERCGLRGWEQYENAGQAWPGGTMGAPADAALMMGESGIGYFYLRLYSTETPSVLLLQAPRKVISMKQHTRDSLEVETMEDWFGRTLSVMDAIQAGSSEPDAASYPEQHDGSLLSELTTSDVTAVYEEIQSQIAGAREPQKTFLEDAFRAERARYEMALMVKDYTQEFVGAFQRPSVDEVPWEDAIFSLPEHARFIGCRYDWDEWLVHEPESPPSGLQEHSVSYLIYRKNNCIHERRLGAFTSILLSEILRPTHLDKVVTQVGLSLDTSCDRQVLRKAIIKQLDEAYEAGLLNCHYDGNEVSEVALEDHSAFV